MFTMVLSIWTAVHMNIPEPQDLTGTIRHLGRRVGGVACGLIAPG
jgi:hypothetical protein